MSSELLTARNLLSRAAGLLEFHAERGSAVAANLNKEITDFLWPEESGENPTLESRLSTEKLAGTQCGEPCGSTDGRADGYRKPKGESTVVGVNPSGYQAPPAGGYLRHPIRIYEDDGA